MPLSKESRGSVLSPEDRTKLFEAAQAKPHWQAAFLFDMISINTSAGPKEVATLRLKDVDLENRLIVVQPGGAKNVHRVRPIPLNQEAFQAVKLAVARARELGACEPDHYLFPYLDKRTQTHDATRYQTTFKTAWKRIREKAGLPKFRLYDLRTTQLP